MKKTVGCAMAMILAGMLAARTTPTSTGASQGSTTPTTLPATPPKATTLPKKTTPAVTFRTFGDGTQRVGKDIRPGTYRTREGSDNCYWARLKGLSGDLGDLLANDNTNFPAVVTILKTDKGFETDGCGTWTTDLSQITSSKTKFGSGTFIVGTDIAPGTYRSSGGGGCYWARVKGFTGDLSDLLANDNTDHAATVTIKSTDKGFIATDCGTWTKA